MDQTGEIKQRQKPKTCKLAVASPLVIILGLVTGLVFIGQRGIIEDLGIVFIFGSPLVGLILAIISIWEIRRSKGALKGYFFSILGVCLAVIITLIIKHPTTRHRKPSIHAYCLTNLSGLGKAMFLYCNEYGNYPAKDTWCDLLIKYEDVDEKTLVCRNAFKTGDKGPCHYALNPNCSPNSPNDVVLLFETKGGWNQYGGSELLTLENHDTKDYGKWCYILFNNGRVEPVKAEQLGELNWGNKPKDNGIKGRSIPHPIR